jgi:hypothetical protein
MLLMTYMAVRCWKALVRRGCPRYQEPVDREVAKIQRRTTWSAAYGEEIRLRLLTELQGIAPAADGGIYFTVFNALMRLRVISLP